MKTIPTGQSDESSANPAADLVRQKLAQLYSTEPNAKEELVEAKAETHRSEHQQFMYQLSTSGKSLAEIQTVWHNYYVGLPDSEKHQVWQEFYQEHSRRTHTASVPLPAATPVYQAPSSPVPTKSQDPRTVADIKKQVLKRVQSRPRQKPSHLKSLLFGLSCGLIVVVILLFGFFNERFIAPFITPSKAVSNESLIIDPSSDAAGPNPEIIIPKINVEIPVVYTAQSIDDTTIQSALEQGVVHYPTTSNPGEQGVGAIFGHSSNNILNKGKYKFAFVLLHRLVAGDTFILQKDSKRYVYRVFATKIVKPQDVSVLNDAQGKPAVFDLITCDPPGTSLNRLVVSGEQITPDPSTNVASTAKKDAGQPAILPSNSESLWHRLTHWFSS